MKTYEFKVYLNNKQRENLDRYLEILKVVWNRGLALLEWKQHYNRLQKCTADSEGWVDTWGFDLKPVRIEITKINKDWVYYSQIAADFRKDKSKGWEVKDNVQTRGIINLVKPHWESEPLINNYGAIDLRKPFAQKRYPWIKEQDIPMLLVNDFIGATIVTAWKAYQQGKRKKPRYKGRKDKLRTVVSESFRKHCQRDGNKVKLPGFGWINVKNLSDRLAEDADISTFKVCRKPSGIYLQLGVHEEKIRKSRHKSTQLILDPVSYETEGLKMNMPRYLEKSLLKLEKLQQKLSTQEFGSNRWKKQKEKISKLHEKIKRQRKGWQDWHSSAIADVYSDITIIEYSDTKNRPDPIIAKDGKTYLPNGAGEVSAENKFVLDASVGSFRDLIVRRVEEKGGTITIEKITNLENQIDPLDINSVSIAVPAQNTAGSKKRRKRKQNKKRKEAQELLETAT